MRSTGFTWFKWFIWFICFIWIKWFQWWIFWLIWYILINQITQFISLLGMRSATPRPGPNGLEKMAKTKGPGSKGLVRGSRPKGQALVEQKLWLQPFRAGFGWIQAWSRIDLGRSKCIQVGAGSVLARFSFGSGSVLGRRWVLVGVFLDVAATKYRLFLIFKSSIFWWLTLQVQLGGEFRERVLGKDINYLFRIWLGVPLPARGKDLHKPRGVNRSSTHLTQTLFNSWNVCSKNGCCMLCTLTESEIITAWP